MLCFSHDYLCELLLLWFNIALHFTDCYSCTLRHPLIINFSLSCSHSFMNSFPLFIYKLTSCYLITFRGVSVEERRSANENQKNNNNNDDEDGDDDERVTLSKNEAKNERQEKRAQFHTGEDEWIRKMRTTFFFFLLSRERRRRVIRSYVFAQWLYGEVQMCICMFTFLGVACLSCVQKAFLRWNCNCSTYLLTAKVKYLLFFALVVIFLPPFFPI